MVNTTAGLQVYNANGQLTLEVTDRITRVTGTGQTVSNVAGSMVVPGVSTQTKGTPFYQVLTSPQFPFGSPGTSHMPQFNISGNTVTWTAATIPCQFIVGVY